MARELINTKQKLADAVGFLQKFPRLSHDTETFGPVSIPDVSGLYPFHGARSFAHIIANGTDEFYFDFNNSGIDTKFKSMLQPIFDDPTRIIYYVNAIFDATISYFDGIEIKSRIVDIPSIARIDYNKHGKNDYDETSFLSLDYLARFYKVQLKDDRVKKYIAENNLYSKEKCRFTSKKIPLYHKVPKLLMFEYGCADARSTYDLGQKVISCINHKDNKYQTNLRKKPTMLSVAQNEIQLTSVLVDMKIKGMRIWEDYTKRAIEHEQNISKILHEEVDKLTGGLNLNSGKQLAEYLISKGVELPRKDPTDNDWKMYDKWMERAQEFKDAGKTKHYNEAIKKAFARKAGSPITDKKMLAKLVEQYPELDFLSKVTRAKEAEKKINTYYKNFMLLKDDNGVIHCGLNQEAAKTGRFSSSSPNLQNLEKVYVEPNSGDFSVRSSFIADKGCFLLFVDYDQQEMIVMLDQSEEMGVIDKLKSGEYEDFYLAVKAILKELLGLEFSRYDIKQISLALAYGLGNEGLGRNLKIISPNATPQEIEEGKQKVSDFKKKFFSALSRLKALQKKLENQVKWYGKIHNALGRVIYLDKHESYKALNAFVQSTSADITKRAMVKVHQYFKEAGLESRLSLCVHDELVFNIKFGEEDKAIPLIKKAMVEAYPYKHIPLSVGFEYSAINKEGVSPWGEKRSYDEKVNS